MTMTEAYKVQLKDVFEGPMDLLVHLVKKNDVDIYDIPIAIIVEQYLGYMEIMEELSLEVSGDFLVMAASLMHIKSRMLIPAEQDNDEETEDPRMEIVRPLEEFLRIRNAADKLSGLSLLDRDIFCRPATEEMTDMAKDLRSLRPVGLFELIDAFQRIAKGISKDHLVDITKEMISVKQKISELMEILDEKKDITFQELFIGEHSREMLIITFLAVLEMIRLNLIRVMQHADSGIIRIYGG
jgi:segregation and condensation protein A